MLDFLFYLRFLSFINYICNKYDLMKKRLLSFAFLIAAQMGFSQVVINEIDSDTPSTDLLEFVELKSNVPFYPLDNFVLVFYNGGTDGLGNKSYYALDLDGVTTDMNGLAVIGNQNLEPYPNLIMPNSTLQNGPDVVALFTGSAADFPYNSVVTSTNLVDALAYVNSSPSTQNVVAPTALMTALNLTSFYNEDANNNKVNESIQRISNGVYTTSTPTPFRLNDGSGISFNLLRINTNQTVVNEGSTLNITFQTQQPVTENLNFTYTMANGDFNAADYTANLNVTIPTGQNSVSVAVLLNLDQETEGEELMKIAFDNLPNTVKRMNDSIAVRVIDADFQVLNFGTPLQPTYGQVTREIPENYYAAAIGLAGEQLKSALSRIIADPTVVRKHVYGDIPYILKRADQNPQNSNEVWLMYKETPRNKSDYQTTASSTGKWNREHIFPQSRGGFAGATSSTYDGYYVWESTNSADIAAGHADAHHLRAEDGPENSSRGNKNYGAEGYNGPTGNQGSWKGDVARALFYMAVRYDALNVENGYPSETGTGTIGDLATLLQWNVADPADDFEMNRNKYIYTWQYNRNPFIDYPELAEYIWGGRRGQVWNPNLSVANNAKIQVGCYPNPASDRVTFYGLQAPATVSIFNAAGQLVFKKEQVVDVIHFDLANGMYFVQVDADGQASNLKLIISNK